MAVHEQEKHQNLKIDYYSFVSRQRLKVNSCLFLLSLPTQTLSTSTSLCVTCVIDRLHTFCETDSIVVFFLSQNISKSHKQYPLPPTDMPSLTVTPWFKVLWFLISCQYGIQKSRQSIVGLSFYTWFLQIIHLVVLFIVF